MSRRVQKLYTHTPELQHVALLYPMHARSVLDVGPIKRVLKLGAVDVSWQPEFINKLLDSWDGVTRRGGTVASHRANMIIVEVGSHVA